MMEQALTLASSNSLMQQAMSGIGQASNQACIQQAPWYQQTLGCYHICTCRTETVYITAPADVAVEKVENGFLVKIKGKQYIAANPSAIALLIQKNLNT